MKLWVLVLSIVFISGCSVSIPRKQQASSTWHFSPPATPLQGESKPVALVIAKPWVASGYDTNQVVVSIGTGERDVLADVVWSENHSQWLRNYFIEGFQSSGQFNIVTGNQTVRDNKLLLRIHLWDMSVHYESMNKQDNPVVKLKLVLTATDGRGKNLMNQQVITASRQISENRVVPIMEGFKAVIEECFKKSYQALVSL